MIGKSLITGDEVEAKWNVDKFSFSVSVVPAQRIK